MSDRLAVFNRRPDRAGRHAGRGLRAPGDRVRRRLRRRRRTSLRARERRGRRSRSGPRRSGCSTSRSAVGRTTTSSDGRVRDVVYLGHGHPLRRRPRRRRRAAGRHAQNLDDAPRREALEQQGTARRALGWQRRARPTPSRTAGQLRGGDTVRHEPDWWLRSSPVAGARAARRCGRGGCGDDDVDGGSAGSADDGAEALTELGEGEGAGQPDRLGRLRRGRHDRPDGRLGAPIRGGDRLQGQRRRSATPPTRWSADADRRVRRRVGLRRRHAAADRRRRRRAGQHRPDPELRRRLRRPQGPAATTRVDGVHYGVPHGRGANLLMCNTDVVTPAPDSWGVVFDAELAVQGQGHGVRLADLHRRRGAVPDGDPARPRDQRTRTRSTRSSSTRPSTCSSSSSDVIGEYWSRLHRSSRRPSTSGDSVRRHDLAGHRQPASRRRRRSPRRSRCCRRRARPAGPTPG